MKLLITDHDNSLQLSHILIQLHYHIIITLQSYSEMGDHLTINSTYNTVIASLLIVHLIDVSVRFTLHSQWAHGGHTVETRWAHVSQT